MHAGGNGNQEEREQQRAASYREREEGWRRRRGEGRGAHSGDEKPQAGGGLSGKDGFLSEGGAVT